MSAHVTPSREKFRKARKIAGIARELLGSKFKGAFVAGSVASNMALPSSDIDMGIVYNEKMRWLSVLKVQLAWYRAIHRNVGFKAMRRLHPAFYTTLEVEHRARKGMLKGIVPVLDPEGYLKKFVARHRLTPRKDFILERYGEYKGGMQERVSFKRSKAGRKRFLH